jgi:LPS export ABC transporter permease LptG/LPS export ABC transporter permease LptF
VSILDRYLIRTTIPPFLLSLGVFTFVLAVMPMLEYAKLLLAKGVPLPTVGLLLLLLLPQALSLTIPMAFLSGLLMALGRLSGDRESVALLACGISPARLLRPVLLVAVLVAGLDMYVLARATPDANQAWRSITFHLLTEQSAAEIRPRVFFERFPKKVLYVQDNLPGGRWSKVFLADTSEPGRPMVTMAESGGLVVDRERRAVTLVLDQVAQYSPGQNDPRAYRISLVDSVSQTIEADSVFGTGNILPGLREMSVEALLRKIDEKRAQGIPAHAEIMQFHQMVSFPVACLIFGAIALALGLNTRQEGRLAGLALGLAVILVYYAVMALAEGWVQGVARTGAPVDGIAAWARWIPNIVLAALAGLALWRQTRPNGLNLPIRAPAWFHRRRPRPQAPAPAGSAGGPVVLVRMPWFTLPLPRLLDRYVGGQFARAGALAFLGLLALYYIGAFVDLADKIFKNPEDARVFARFLIHSTPQFVALVIPVATLIAVLGTIGALTRSGELTVMRACGVSLYRLAVPLLLFAGLGSLTLFAIEERVLGEANRTAAGLRDELRDGPGGPRTLNVANLNWLVAEDGRIYNYLGFESASRLNGNRPAVRALSVFEPQREPYRLREHQYAFRAFFEGGAWRAEHGWSQRFDADTTTREEYDVKTLPLAPPADFQRAQVDASLMNFRELLDYVRRLGASGYNVAEHSVDLHRKLAFPMVTIVMTLLAIPFGVTIGRKGTLYGIGLAAILAGGYFLLMTFFVAVGAAGLLPPMLAAWGANIIFGAGALYMMFTVRT